MKNLIKLFLIAIFPLIVTLWLYPLSGKVISSGYTLSEFKIENIFEQKQPTIKNLIGDIFSAPLHLDWYKVSLKNNLSEQDPDCLLGKGPPVTRFSFIKGNPGKYETNFKEEVVDTGWGPMQSTYPDYYFKSGEERYFVAPSWEQYSILGGVVFSGECEISLAPSGSYHVVMNQIVTLSPYLPSWFARLAIIFVTWIVLLASLVSIKDWVTIKKGVVEKKN